MSKFKRAVLAYMDAVERQSGRRPSYHDAAAEVAHALKATGASRKHCDRPRKVIG